MENEIREKTDPLYGYDTREFQRRMVEGLEDWLCRRREKARDRRLYLATTCVMLVLVSVAYRLAPTADYRLAEGVSYEELVEINNKMLEQ